MLRTKIYKIKKGKEDQWHSWCKELHDIYHQEAITTILQEKNVLEAFYIFAINDEYYTVGVGIGEFAMSDEDSVLNIKHKQQKSECLGESIELQELYQINLLLKKN